MFGKLFKSKTVEAKISRAPDGQTLYAIGDIHGCLDALLDLLGQIERHASASGLNVDDPRHTIIFLGDLIDRGPDSAGVVEHLLHYRPAGFTLRYLMGNHEEIFLDVMGGNVDAMQSWFQFGGKGCARSYGVDNLGEIMMRPESLLHRIRGAVPQAHIDFISGFEDYAVLGDYVFVHAGLRPRVALAQQKPSDMRWIRSKFLDFNGAFDYRVVHGHSVVETADIRPNRIAVDTGAYKPGGRLSAAVLHGDTVDILQSAPSSAPKAAA